MTDQEPPNESLNLNLTEWHFEAPQFKVHGYHSREYQRPLIHFLHGNGLSCGSYFPFLSHFQPDFDLFLHNIQGHGLSHAGQAFAGYDNTIAICHDVIQRHIKPKYDGEIIGMGHSMGGILTLLLAEKYPGLFDRLILLDPVFFPVPFELNVKHFKNYIRSH